MSEVGWVHFVFCMVAIGAGAVVLLLGKGTRWHRTWGHLYAMSMLGALVSALLMYQRNGRFGPFHFAALVGGVTLAGGLYSVLRRRPKKQWMEAHAIWMSWSYIGLMAALVAETATRLVMPALRPYFETNAQAWTGFWVSVGVASFAVCGAGWWLVKTRVPGAVASTPEAMRHERNALRVSTDTA